jgi:MFS family permease
VLAPLLSHSIGTLIFFRALQGIAYSAVVSITQAAIVRAFEPAERGKALGVNVVFVSAGQVSGPIIGGFLLAYFSWHAIFYLSAAFGVLGYLGTLIALENDSVKNTRQKTGFPWRRLLRAVHRGSVHRAQFLGRLGLPLAFLRHRDAPCRPWSCIVPAQGEACERTDDAAAALS